MSESAESLRIQLDEANARLRVARERIRTLEAILASKPT